MNNLYIALSTHHLKYCEIIASQYPEDNNVVITSGDFEIDRSFFNRIIIFDRTPYNQSSSLVSKISDIIGKTRTYRKVVDDIKDLKFEPHLTLYFSSLEDVLSNYLFFNFSDQLRGVIIEDGVLNYYEHSFDNVSTFNFSLKKIIALLHGIKIETYTGHTSGIDYHRVKYQLVREPKYAVRSKKSESLPNIKRNAELLNDDILIVGQEPYAALFGKKIYWDKLKKLVSFVKRDKTFRKDSTIFYKPHRHGPRVALEKLKALFPDNPFVYIGEDKSMEDLYFGTIKCKNIYTFDSSAVFSIYSDAHFETRESLNINVMPFSNSVLNALFTKLNFRIIKDDI